MTPSPPFYFPSLCFCPKDLVCCFERLFVHRPFSIWSGLICTEKPKSVSLMFISSSKRTFSGFRSRWTMPWLWRNCTTSIRARIIFLTPTQNIDNISNTIYFHFEDLQARELTGPDLVSFSLRVTFSVR